MIKLNVVVDEDFIAVNMEDGTEIVCWNQDEWEEDPTIVPAICNAIDMAYTDPDRLIGINQRHIDSQKDIEN